MARPQAYATKAKISRALYQNLRLLGTNSRPDAESGSYQLTGRWLWAAVAFREGSCSGDAIRSGGVAHSGRSGNIVDTVHQ